MSSEDTLGRISLAHFQSLRFTDPLSPVTNTLIASHIFIPQISLGACQSGCCVTTAGGLTDVSPDQVRITGPVRPSNSLSNIILHQARIELAEQY